MLNKRKVINKYDLYSLISKIRYFSREIQMLDDKSALDEVDIFHLEVLQGSFWHWMQVLIRQENMSMQRAIEYVNGKNRLKVNN